MHLKIKHFFYIIKQKNYLWRGKNYYLPQKITPRLSKALAGKPARPCIASKVPPETHLPSGRLTNDGFKRENTGAALNVILWFKQR